MRRDLCNKLKGPNSEKVSSGTCFRISLPLSNAHTTHRVDPLSFTVKSLRKHVQWRAESLIRQGVSHRSLLRDMLQSYVDHELLNNIDLENLPSDFDLKDLYPSKDSINNYIQKYVKRGDAKCFDSPNIRTVKLQYINKVQLVSFIFTRLYNFIQYYSFPI